MKNARIERFDSRRRAHTGVRLRPMAGAALLIAAIAGLAAGGAGAAAPIAARAAGAAGSAGVDGSPGDNAGGSAGSQGSPASPVVVELFTSQGCSTCPPADRLLTQLGSGAAAGPVIPLAFHVDYWNRQGWTDPFSAAEWTARQARYGRALHVDDIYTPQLVVNGRSQCVGSKRDEVMQQIAAAQASAPAGKVSIDAAEVTGRKVVVKVQARVERPAHSLELWVALTQSDLTTAVSAGENKAATLHDDFVVRRLEKAFSVSGKPGAERAGEVRIAVDPKWDRSQLAVVAFLQDPSTLAIEGAASRTLAAGR
ncbi:MAG: DUF1223 domain-containing protein [Acidobacteria bacterium]|nr:DUF1223 domain-containing protein [Acidobacteriota bacterium]